MKKLLTIVALLSLGAGAYAATEAELRGRLEALDKKADAHLQKDADNATHLSDIMDEYTDIVHSAPRRSEIRRDAHKSRAKFDCGVEREEDKRDDIEDRVHSGCWCRSCR